MLKDLRKRKELKQTDLAAAIGVSQAMISEYENNPSRIMSASFDIIIRYAEALGISIDEFAGIIRNNT